MKRSLAACFIIALLAFVTFGAWAARPGGGRYWGASASSSVNPPRPVVGHGRAAGVPTTNKSSEVLSEPWSHRPPYAAPWTASSAPPPKIARVGGLPPKVEYRGSMLGYFFWIIVGAAIMIVVMFAGRVLRARAETAWSVAPLNPGAGGGQRRAHASSTSSATDAATSEPPEEARVDSER